MGGVKRRADEAEAGEPGNPWKPHPERSRSPDDLRRLSDLVEKRESPQAESPRPGDMFRDVIVLPEEPAKKKLPGW